MARITIKSLEEKLKIANEEKNKYFGLWQDAKAEIQKSSEFMIMRRDAEESSAQREVGNLMQIIRILAKDPTITMPTINQEDFHRI